MILVDSSVWIDFFRNKPTLQAEWLDRNLGVEGLVVGDLVLAEVLQGFKDDKGFNEAKRLLGQLEQVIVGGTQLAIQAARNYRTLRSVGVTVRGTVDVLIATRCLTDGFLLLHSDRDFDAFEQHLSLRVVNCEA
ncbi:MAG: PIN domain nuclease [Candidatus Competibacteraceae bacterium]|nr:PIN domain nuclease [Candidatus Competibacteraceae bacterium]MBK7982617.1 PIN domain nuclease [Candidatus Competibacteraceae bacterium]MBK8898836.1 PIN domain nuclease [Candidatus Competibacteraceae bacterium]MBK8962634.1 PIN domain nuclease [Candidatus Competibacteraceae bacterium]